MTRVLGWAATLALLGGQGAAAQPRATGPIVVVVESSDAAVDPDAFRQRLAQALSVPVRSLGASDGERSLVLVQVVPDEPARVRIQRPGQAPRRLTVPRGSGAWLVEGVLEAMGRASLVTWEGESRPPAAPVLAEWEEPSARGARGPVESGAALDPPPR